MAKSNPVIVVRRARRGDAPEIAYVLHEAFKEYGELYTTAAFSATVPTAARIVARMREGPVWVAERGSTIVGTISAAAQGSRLHIRGMAVLPNAQGLGVGLRLLNHAQRYAARNGYASLHLETTPFLTRAIRLYESSGFMRPDRHLHDYHGTPVLSMVKCLRPVQRDRCGTAK